MKKRIIIFGILLLILLVNPILAQPSISSVSGSVADGGSVSISGFGFGATGPSLYKWDDFEGSTHVLNDPVGAGPGTITWTFGSNLLTILDVNNRPGSIQYCNINVYSGSDYSPGLQFGYGGIAAVSPIYITFYHRWDANGGGVPDNANWKHKLVMRNNMLNGPDVGLAGHNGGSSTFMVSIRLDDKTSSYLPTSSGTIPTEGDWTRIEFYGEESSGGVAEDGTVVVAWQKSEDAIFTTVVDREGDLKTRTTEHWRVTWFFEFAGMDAAVTDFDVDLDDIYIADSRARVEIGDNPNLDSCTHREIQVPTVWADSSITVNINQGSFTNGETAYLFVVDENGVMNPTGYAVTIAGTPTYECSDFIDNDGDGAIDFPNDTGCTDVNDNDETNCDDGVCEGGETCSSCESDCLNAEELCCDGISYDPLVQVCCSGVIYTGDCCLTIDCTSPETCINYVCSITSQCGLADTNGDNIVSITEIMNYITQWKAGSVTISELMIGIGEWKNGC